MHQIPGKAGAKGEQASSHHKVNMSRLDDRSVREPVADGERALQSEKRGGPNHVLVSRLRRPGIEAKVAFVGDTAPIVRIQNFLQPLAESFYSLAY